MASFQEIYDKAAELHDKGRLSKAVTRILKYMANCAPSIVTQHEVAMWYGDSENSIGPRFADLEKHGFIECTGKVMCKNTGKPRKSYRLTGKLPSGPVTSGATKKMVTCPRCGCTFGPRKREGNK